MNYLGDHVFDKIPVEYQSTIKMIKQAYPNEIPDAEFQDLVCVIAEQVSDRSAASILSFVTSEEKGVLYNSYVIECAKNSSIRSAEIDGIREKLMEFGYWDWLHTVNFADGSIEKSGPICDSPEFLNWYQHKKDYIHEYYTQPQ
jgi:hypothetical protein